MGTRARAAKDAMVDKKNEHSHQVSLSGALTTRHIESSAPVSFRTAFKPNTYAPAPFSCSDVFGPCVDFVIKRCMWACMLTISTDKGRALLPQSIDVPVLLCLMNGPGFLSNDVQLLIITMVAVPVSSCEQTLCSRVSGYGHIYPNERSPLTI